MLIHLLDIDFFSYLSLLKLMIDEASEFLRVSCLLTKMM